MDASLPTAPVALGATRTAASRMPVSAGSGGSACEALCFCGFRLFPSARVLLREGTPVDIGSRAFDLLHLLLRSRGAVVERADIFRQVWPTTIVDESNLRFQVSCLRRILGDDRHLLKTVPGRGYMLATEAQTAQGAQRTDDDLGLSAIRAATSKGDPDQALQVLGDLLSAMLEEIRALRRPDRNLALPGDQRRAGRRHAVLAPATLGSATTPGS